MSIESAKAFLERLKSDEDFRKKVGEITTKEQRVEYVKEAGYDFSKEELDGVTAELSHEELEGVAGGTWGCGVTHESEQCTCDYHRGSAPGMLAF